MKIKDIPIRSIIECCGAVAEVLKHGPMGTRVKVLTVKTDESGNAGLTTGLQVWSSETEVSLNEQNVRSDVVLAQIGNKVPLTLF